MRSAHAPPSSLPAPDRREQVQPLAVLERGVQAGVGTNCNVPLPPGASQEEYLSALGALLERLCAYDPRWLVVSAGFDTYVHDPISTFQLTTAAFYKIGLRIRALNKPTLVVQEGGYHVPDLGRNVVTLLQALAES